MHNLQDVFGKQRNDRKQQYFERVQQLFDEYPQAFVVTADNVSAAHLSGIRKLFASVQRDCADGQEHAHAQSAARPRRGEPEARGGHSADQGQHGLCALQGPPQGGARSARKRARRGAGQGGRDFAGRRLHPGGQHRPRADADVVPAGAQHCDQDCARSDRNPQGGALAARGRQSGLVRGGAAPEAQHQPVHVRPQRRERV